MEQLKRGRGRPGKHAADALIDNDTPWEEDDRAWYVVACHPGGLTLDQLGQLYGVTRERIRQIESSALKTLEQIDDGRGAQMLRRLLRESLERELQDESDWKAEGAPMTHGIGRGGQWLYPREERAKKVAAEMRKRREITVGGETMSIADWAKRLRMSPTSVYNRLGAGWTEEEAVTTASGDVPERLLERAIASGARLPAAYAAAARRRASAAVNNTTEPTEDSAAFAPLVCVIDGRVVGNLQRVEVSIPEPGRSDAVRLTLHVRADPVRLAVLAEALVPMAPE